MKKCKFCGRLNILHNIDICSKIWIKGYDTAKEFAEEECKKNGIASPWNIFIDRINNIYKGGITTVIIRPSNDNIKLL